MIKEIQLQDGTSIAVASSAAFLYLYKNQFKRDPLKDLMGLIENLDNTEVKEISGEELIQKVNIQVLYDMTWALAKCADKTIGDPMEFYLDNPEFLPLEHIEELMELVTGSLVSTNKLKKK